MKPYVRISMIISGKYQTDIERIFKRYQTVDRKIKDFKDGDCRFLYLLSFDKNTLMNVRNDLYSIGIKRFGEAFFFYFSHEDYENAPLFCLKSTGNSPRAFLKSKGTNDKKVTVCPTCGFQTKRLESELQINTHSIGTRYMVNVDTHHWVVSEKMAELMDKWNISGYRLKSVKHIGPKEKQQPAYQLIPTYEMPPWSSKTKFVEKKRAKHCDHCHLRGTVIFPFHYDRNTLTEIKDVNLSGNWSSTGSEAYKELLLSRRFRKMVIEEKITRDVRNPNFPNRTEDLGSKDWWFEPVIVV